MTRVLVLDANTRHSLVAVRCLGSRGLSVTTGAVDRRPTAALSRYADDHVQYPEPVANREAFLDALEAELRAREYAMVLPIADATVIPIVENQARFAPYTNVPFGPLETMRECLDKKRTMDAAREAGVPHPASATPADFGFDPETDPTLDREAVAAELGFPVLVKPRVASQRQGVTVCESHDALERAVAETTATHGEVLLQEYLPNGGELGVYTMYDASSTLAGVTVQKRLRSNPPEGGPSTLRETIEAPALVEQTDRLLSSLGWTGVAMAEYRRDARDGEAKLIEVNPRLWGSLALSTYAGVPFSYMLYELAVEGEVTPHLEYDVGVQARWLVGDVLQLLKRDDRTAALREFLQPAAGRRCYDVLSLSDPLPFVGYTVGGIASQLRG